ncbi:MAG: MarC family protein [Bacteroidales bacterium]|nr:MarC family protein [Bacteroidales bacterium]
MWGGINFVEILSAFVIMFAIIDVTGSIPIFLNIKKQNQEIKAWQSCLIALLLFLLFYFAGDALLKLFGVDTASFAVAGSFVIFILALEMILGREIIKNDQTKSGASIVPIAFPLIAGPGALTTLLSLRAEYAVINIMIALLLNMLIVYVVLISVEKIEKVVGENVIYIFRKFFGVILLAIAVKMFASNLAIVVANLSN